MAVPGRPPAISISDVTTNSFFVSMADGTNGGKPITVRQMGLSTSSAGIQTTFNTGNTHTMSPLNPGTTYFVWARCGNADGWGGWAGPVSATTLNPSLPPGRVPAISISSVTDNSFFVSFQDPSSSQPITVRQIGIGVSSSGIQNVVNVGGTTETIGNLQSGTTYYIWARAGSNAGWGEWGGPVSATTVAPRAPNPPPALSLGSITDDSIFVSFSQGYDGGSPINRRQIGFSTNSAGIQNTVEPIGQNTATISPLTPATTYYFWARLGNNYGWSDWTGPVMGKTVTPAVPSRPPAISVSDVKAEQAFVSFQAGASPTDPVTGHQVGYGTNPTTHMYAVPLAANQLTTTLTKLIPETQYYVWARTSNKNGFSAWAGPITFTTTKALKPPGPPSAVLLSNTTTTSVEATFSPPEYEGTSPILEMQLGYGTNSGGASIFVASTGYNKLTGLQPGSRYYFWARARNEVGWGEWSPVSSEILRAGAFVTVNFQGVAAIPYVNVNGVWRIAQPWIKNSGSWKGL